MHVECGGGVKVITCVEDAVEIAEMLTHVKVKVAPTSAGLFPDSGTPPQADLFG